MDSVNAIRHLVNIRRGFDPADAEEFVDNNPLAIRMLAMHTDRPASQRYITAEDIDELDIGETD